MELGISKGDWKSVQTVGNCYNIEVKNVYTEIIANITGENNSALIADAGTTANKCQLLPSELLVQRDELLKSLIEVIEFNEITFKRLGPDYTKMIDLAKTRINKAL